MADSSAASGAAAVLSSSLSTPADVTYPVEIPVTAGIQASMDAADSQTKALDAKCAHLPIAASLASRRPGGTGCPRDIVDAGGAQ